MPGHKCNRCGEKITAKNIAKTSIEHRMYTCRECTNELVANRGTRIKYNRKLKKDIVEGYGGKCVCCGETAVEFLSIDHINGGGKKHREELGGSANRIYVRLRQQDYPKKKYRLLCMNCNTSLGHYGYCPHEKESK